MIRVVVIGLIFVGLGAAEVAAQSVREVDFSADSSRTQRMDGRQVTELFNVFLREDETRLRARRAIDYGNGDFHFYSDVRIVDQGDTLTADQMRYNRITKIGRATGRVRLGDGEVVVTAPEGDFDMNADRADFRSGVRMVDSTSVLTSTYGSYWTQEKRAEFFGSVHLDSDDTDVLADSLTYWREAQRSDARGDVLIVRKGGDLHTLILAARALNDDKLGTGRATGDVLVARIPADSSFAADADTLLIVAHEVHSTRDDSLDATDASGSVQIWSAEFSARADSIRQRVNSTTDRNESRLFGNPFLWVSESQVNGDSMLVVGREGGIDSLVVTGTSYVAQRDSTLGRIQQLKGRGLLGLFESDSLKMMQVSPNAEAVFYSADENGGLAGALNVTADQIRFLFEGGEIDSMGVYSDVDGTYFPAELIPEVLRLDGLVWRPEDRPEPGALRNRLLAALARIRAEEQVP